MLRLDPRSSEPPFAQLREQITTQVAEGVLAPGDRLPTVRRLAGDLGIAPNTVARAYRELEIDRVLEGRGRAGTFVRAGAGQGGATSGGASAWQAAQTYADLSRSLGVQPTEALDLVRKALRAVPGQ